MKRISILIAVAMPLFVLSGEASAGDAKVLPGTMCQTMAGISPKGRYGQGTYQYIGSSSGHTVVCPILRETTESVLREVKVRVRHSTFGSSSTRCRISSQSDDAASGDQTEEMVHTTSSPASKEMVFTIDGLDHFNGGTFSVNCSLGPNYEIMSIRYSEDT